MENTPQPNSALEATSEVDYFWVSSIKEIKQDDWERCFDTTDFRNSYELVEAIEFSNFLHITFHYLIVKEEQIVAIIPCYIQSTYLDIIAPDSIHKVCNKIRKFFTSFFEIKTFIVGIPIATCSGLLGVSAIPTKNFAQIMHEIVSQLQKATLQHRAKFIVVKEVEEDNVAFIKEHFSPSFNLLPSQTTAYIPLKKNSSYVTRLRKHYRAVYKQRKRFFTEGELTWEISRSFDDQIDEIYSLFTEVELRQRPVIPLPKEFFSRLSKLDNGNCYLLIAKKDSNTVAFGLIFACSDKLFPIYIGFNYEQRNQYALYHNTLYRALEEAEAKGFSEIILGQTSLESKALIGASFKNLYLAVLPMTRFYRFILKTTGKYLFPVVTPPKHNVLKD